MTLPPPRPATTIEVARPAPDDLPGIARCLADYRFHLFGPSDLVDPDFPGDAILHVRNGICAVDLQEKSWVARSAGQLLGFCCWEWMDQAAGAARTLLISVCRQARSRGVGSLLQDRRLQEMLEQGAGEVHTWSDHPDAIRWYRQRYGYELLHHEPIRHCIHSFHLGHRTFWGIHRGHPDRDRLAHLRLDLSVWSGAPRDRASPIDAMPEDNAETVAHDAHSCDPQPGPLARITGNDESTR